MGSLTNPPKASSCIQGEEGGVGEEVCETGKGQTRRSKWIGVHLTSPPTVQPLVAPMATDVGNSELYSLCMYTCVRRCLRQTVHTHRASVHQAAKLVAALLRVAGVTAGLAESSGSPYRRVHDSRHLQADCQEPGSAPEPYAR